MDLSRFRPILGSLVINGAMVATLIWSWSDMTTTLQNVNARLVHLELVDEQRFAGYQRLAAVEAKLDSVIAAQEILREDTMKRLERIEAKLDRIR